MVAVVGDDSDIRGDDGGAVEGGRGKLDGGERRRSISQCTELVCTV
jgi:hypothetical protein